MMKFYHLSISPLRGTGSVITPYLPFGHARYQGQQYTSVFTTIEAACRHLYPDVFTTILQTGYATAHLYELHLSKEAIASLITPEVMTLDGLRYFDTALTETGKLYQQLELCCLTTPHAAQYVGKVNIFESPEWGKPTGVMTQPYPSVVDYYVVIDKMSDDRSGFVKRKTFSQVSTELRYVSQNYEPLCRQFRLLGKTDDVVPLVLHQGHMKPFTSEGNRFMPPCMTFLLTDKGEHLLRQYQHVLNDVLITYGFHPKKLYVIKSTGHFTRHVKDYYDRENRERTCDYLTSLVSFVYRDKDMLRDDEAMLHLRDAYELALLMLID